MEILIQRYEAYDGGLALQQAHKEEEESQSKSKSESNEKT